MCKTKIQRNFIAKNKQNEIVRKKKYPKLVLNKLKVMGNFTFIYTYQTFSLRTSNLHVGHLHPYVAHVYPCVNYELIRNEIKVNKELTKS
jgi:hypothetical protein